MMSDNAYWTVVFSMFLIAIMLIAQPNKAEDLSDVCERHSMEVISMSCKVSPSGKEECTYQCWPVDSSPEEQAEGEYTL